MLKLLLGTNLTFLKALTENYSARNFLSFLSIAFQDTEVLSKRRHSKRALPVETNENKIYGEIQSTGGDS